MQVEDLQQFVVRIKRSDPAAFKIVFDQCHKSIFNFIIFKVRDEQLAEDLLQEVFVRCWNARLRLDENRSIRNYLYTIADNLILNEARHNKVVARQRSEVDLRVSSETDNPQFILEEKEYHVKLQSAIDSLPEKARIVFLMSRLEDLSYQQIADRLSISVKTVESHMVNALRQLREKINRKI